MATYKLELDSMEFIQIGAALKHSRAICEKFADGSPIGDYWKNEVDTIDALYSKLMKVLPVFELEVTE